MEARGEARPLRFWGCFCDFNVPETVMIGDLSVVVCVCSLQIVPSESLVVPSEVHLEVANGTA